MNNPIWKQARNNAVRNATRRHTRGGGLLDVKFGFALFRDRSVPTLRKILALGIGIGVTAILVALELPVEAAVAGLLNLLGFGLDALVDGLEVVACPLLVASLLLPHLIPTDVRRVSRSNYVGEPIQR